MIQVTPLMYSFFLEPVLQPGAQPPHPLRCLTCQCDMGTLIFGRSPTVSSPRAEVLGCGYLVLTGLQRLRNCLAYPEISLVKICLVGEV